MRKGTFVRWGVPIAAAAVIGAALGAGPVVAAVSGDPALPERSAQQLLADAVAAVERTGGPLPMSGTVRQTASLGLPALPQMGGESPLALLSGSHEVKVWYGAQDRLRVAMPTHMNETNLIVNGDEAWYWDSDGNTATKIKVKTGAGWTHEPATPAPTPSDLTPQAAAAKVLAKAGEHTAIGVTNTAEVAGRPAYQLVLRPKAEASLVQEVRLALDGETYVPLRVQVYAKGSAEPAFEVGFTQVTFTPPAEENFVFTPPAGATVEEQTLGEVISDGKAGEHTGEHTGQHTGEHTGDAKAAKDLKVVGEGWSGVVVAPMPDLGSLPAEASGGQGDPAEAKALLDNVLKSATPVSGTWGSGKLITTKLVTVLLTDDGRLLAGAVTPEEIVRVAGTR